MNIGSTYADNKLYRGIKYSDGLPLLAKDLHEFSDTISQKNRYLLDNVVGSGILNTIQPYATPTGVRLREPAVLNVSGDICLIHTSTDVDLIGLDSLSSYDSGSIVVVGWYQNITALTDMKEYGGVINDTLQNDLLYDPLNIQVSSRYQFRWDIVVVEGYVSSDSSLELHLKDANGNDKGETAIITLGDQIGYMFRASAPSSMNYAVDGLYIIPLLDYSYDRENNSLDTVKSSPTRQTSTALLESEVEPSGTFPNGTVWYNPLNREFRTYIKGTGFIPNSSQVGFVQYRYTNTETTDNYISRPQDITYSLAGSSIPDLLDSDLIRVTYEGLELLPSVDYVIDISGMSITLMNFTRIKGETLTVTVTRLVEANDVTNLTELIITHTRDTSTLDSPGHVKLSDSVNSSLGVTEGVAATPKAVRDSQILTDEVTGKKYKLKVSNGELQLSEVI